MGRFRPADPSQRSVVLGTTPRRIAPEQSEMGQKGEKEGKGLPRHRLGLAFVGKRPQIIEKMI